MVAVRCASFCVAVLLVLLGFAAAGQVIGSFHHQSRSNQASGQGIVGLVRRMLYSDAYSYEDEYSAEEALAAGDLGPMLSEAAAAMPAVAVASPVTAGASGVAD